jgi:hypothetical protein
MELGENAPRHHGAETESADERLAQAPEAIAATATAFLAESTRLGSLTTYLRSGVVGSPPSSQAHLPLRLPSRKSAKDTAPKKPLSAHLGASLLTRRRYIAHSPQDGGEEDA